MKNILQTLFFRLKKSILFWVLLGVCAVLPLLSVGMSLLAFYLSRTLGVGEELIGWGAMKNSLTAGALSQVSGFSDHALCAVICTAVFLSKEFIDGTFRNALLANRSRRELYLSYLVMAIMIGVIFLGINFLFTLLFNGAFFGFGDMAGSDAVAACFVSLALGIVSVAFLQAMMCMFLFGTRKLAVALICPIVISMIVPALLSSVMEIFAIVNVISPADMSWVPLYNLNLLNLYAMDGAQIGKILLYLVPLAALFGSLGWITFRNADLK